MKIIDICLCDIVAIILKAKTGFKYSNQTGGVCCNHPEQEGLLIPLENIDIISAVLCKELTIGTFIDNPSYVNKFDTLFQKLKLPLEVDKELLAECQEAWIHVNITEEANKFEFTPLYGLAGMKAVLIYTNSD